MFEDEISFYGSESEGSFILNSTAFVKMPDFTQMKFQGAPRLDHVQWPQIAFFPALASFEAKHLEARYRAVRQLATQGQDHENEAAAFKGEIRSRRGTEHKLWHMGFWFGMAYDALSDFGRSIARPLALWIISIIAFSGIYLWNADISPHHWSDRCAEVKATKWEKALTLSFSNALVVGSPRSHDINAIYACLYNWDIGQSLAEGRRLFLPPWSTALQIAQSLWSAVLIFLFLLAVRNQFKIK